MSSRVRTFTALVFLASLLALQGGCGARSDSVTTTSGASTSRPVPAARHAPFFQAGFAYSRIGGTYDSDVSSIELAKMRAAGGNIVQLLVFAYVYRLNEPGIGMAGQGGDKELRGGISRARAAGLRTMVKLQMWGPGFQEGKYAADIRMANEDDWHRFMANYRRYVLRYARLAAETEADILCLGTEMSQVSRAAAITGDWRALVEEVRSNYSGPLTYAAHVDEVEGVPFWDSLDYIGVDGYYPVAELSSALERLGRLSRRWNRPVIFAEAGFASSSHALTEPWRAGPYEAPPASVRLDLQAEGWRVLLDELWRRDFIWGVYAWKWHPNRKWGGPANADHTPQGKPALDVIRRFYTNLPARGNR